MSTNNHELQVSDDHYDNLHSYGWHASKRGYVSRTIIIDGRRIKIYLGAAVLDLEGIPHPNQVDHIDRNPFNYQKENLRPATQSEQNANRSIGVNNISGYKGVSLCTDTGKWRALIYHKKKKISLGFFTSKEDAARAYDHMALQLFGKFAILNFPGNYVKFD